MSDASGRSGARAYLDTLEQFNPSPELQAIIRKLRADLDAEEGAPVTDEWRAAGVNPPTPRRSITMPATSPAKAILAAIAAFLASFLATVQGRTDLASMKAIDWIIVLLSAAVTGIGVYLVPNRPTGTRRGDVGQANLLYILLVVAAFLLVLWLLFRVA